MIKQSLNSVKFPVLTWSIRDWNHSYCWPDQAQHRNPGGHIICKIALDIYNYSNINAISHEIYMISVIKIAQERQKRYYIFKKLLYAMISYMM